MTAKVANERIIIPVLGLIMFIELLDGTVLQTSLPQIAFSLHVNPLDLKVALTIYLLAVGAFIPAAGWFAERFGTKCILLIATAGFLASSVACGISNTLVALTINRAIQGIFGAFMVPVARLLIVQLFKPRMGEVMAKIVPIFLLGPLIGPVLGGTITTYLNWRFIFFINVPIGLLIITLVYYKFPATDTKHKTAFDFSGFALLSIGLLAMLFAVDTVTLSSIKPFWKATVFAACLICFIFYYFHASKLTNKQLKHKKPVIDLTVFKNKHYLYFSLLLIFYQIFVLNIGFITTLYVQTQLQYTAMTSGLLFIPIILGVLTARAFLTYLNERFSLQKRLSYLLWITIVTQLLLSAMLLHFNLTLYILLLFISGCCNGHMFPTIQQHTYSHLKKQQNTPGSIINSAIKQLSQSFTVAIVAMLLIISSPHIQLHWNTVLPKLSYAIVMWVSAGCMATSGILLMRWFNKIKEA